MRRNVGTFLIANSSGIILVSLTRFLPCGWKTLNQLVWRYLTTFSRSRLQSIQSYLSKIYVYVIERLYVKVCDIICAHVSNYIGREKKRGYLLELSWWWYNCILFCNI